MNSETLNAAGLRHSLRTPLNHIIGYCEMLLEEGPADSPDELRALVAEGREMVRLVQDAFHTDLVSAEDLQLLQAAMVPAADRMAGLVDRLEYPGMPNSHDVARIRFAVERIRDFAASRPGSVPALSGSHPSPAPADTEGAGGRILVVDDSAENRDILRRLLEREGYGLTTVPDGRQGIEQLRTGMFDLMLLDVLMPVMDGFEVLRRMKEEGLLNRTPVVMISALDESKSVIRCIQMGAEDYLAKPFDPVLLSARIGASLEKKRLRDEERRRTEELQTLLDQLRRTQNQLLVQEKLASLGALTAGIAHEIRNPLNFINNFASSSRELIAEIQESRSDSGDSADPVFRQLDQYIGKIEEHGKRAERIVRGMLMHSRGKSGEPELVDLKSLLTDALNLAYHAQRAQDRDFNVCIETSFDPVTGSIRAIPQEISRVFLNICANAFYAVWERRKTADSSFRPEVSVTTRNLGSAVEIRVKDNGCGIEPDVLPSIFNPFFTTKPAGAGTGLGLSISHDIIVGGHSGTIRAESEPGAGAEFIVTLPRGT